MGARSSFRTASRCRSRLAADLTSFGAAFELNALQAVQLVIVARPTVHGFPIRLNVVNAPCGDPAADVAAATSIVANTQNVGVLGQFCSSGFKQALPVYQAAGVVVVSGSATSDALPSFGPTVFDRTAASDGDGFNAWYAQVASLPGDLAWRGAFVAARAVTDGFRRPLRRRGEDADPSLAATAWVDRPATSSSTARRSPAPCGTRRGSAGSRAP